VRSRSQPGSSAHDTAIQRARGCSMVAAGGARDSLVAAGVAVDAGRAGTGSAGGCNGVLEHAAIVPRMAVATHRGANRKALDMWAILLEALAALGLLLFIVWWTMFAGRQKGERSDDERR